MIADIAKTVIAALVLTAVCFQASAQQAVSVSISVKNHRFQPAEIHAPAKVPIELHVKNLDPTPMEFESGKEMMTGLAREAVDGWLAHAFADPRVDRVVAHTLTGLTPSIGVLRSAGFRFTGPGSDPDEPSAIRFEIARPEYEASANRRTPVDLILS
jgi:hypothetical protein